MIDIANWKIHDQWRFSSLGKMEVLMGKMEVLMVSSWETIRKLVFHFGFP